MAKDKWSKPRPDHDRGNCSEQLLQSNEPHRDGHLDWRQLSKDVAVIFSAYLQILRHLRSRPDDRLSNQSTPGPNKILRFLLGSRLRQARVGKANQTAPTKLLEAFY